MQKVLLIGLAGLVGTVGRYALSGVIARRFGETFPAGTLVVNIVGCFLAGLLFYLLQERNLVTPMTRTVVMIG
jgi:CrcB protein